MRHETELVVENRQGIHLNSASRIVQLASRFQADVFLIHLDPSRSGGPVNAKDLVDVLQLAAGPGTRLRLVAEGVDARAALDALARLFVEHFGETA